MNKLRYMVQVQEEKTPNHETVDHKIKAVVIDRQNLIIAFDVAFVRTCDACDVARAMNLAYFDGAWWREEDPLTTAEIEERIEEIKSMSDSEFYYRDDES